MTDPTGAAQRVRAYLKHLPNSHSLGAEFVYGIDERRSGGAYAIDRADLEAVLDQLAAGHADLLAWQRQYLQQHPETGTLELLEATEKEMP